MVDVILRRDGTTRATGVNPDLDISRSNTIVMHITNIQSLEFPHDSPVTTIELPEQAAQENIQIKVSGNSTTLTITWKLGIDPNTSPFTQGVADPPFSALDIMQTISERMVSDSIDNSGYTLIFPNGWEVKGHVDNFTPHIDESAPEVLLCTMRMIIGKSVTSLDVDDSSNQGDDSG